jgi:phospholipid/cholesterol/gamma-HCH transport system ATP-binding protein
MTNLIEINNLSFKRGSRLVFQDINIHVPRGKITAIMGPSGTGKTTLLRLIGAQLQPSSGKIFVSGKDIHQQSQYQLYKMRKKMGLLFQSGGLFTHLNVFENVAFPLREHTKLSEDMIRSLVLMKLEMVGLRGAHDFMPSELSGGMSRRVALARAVALDPSLIMYDEPLSGQDPITKGVLLKLMRTLNDALKLTSIIVSHDVAETLTIADYVYVIAGGKVIGCGDPDSINRNTSQEVRQFLDGMPDGPVPFHYPAEPFIQDLIER